MTGDKIAAVRAALHKLVDKLGEADRLAIVLFNSSARILMNPTPVSNPGYIKGQINRISAGGSTDIESGLRLGFELVARNSGREGISDRVMLFTDALPNTGRTDRFSFLGLTRAYGAEGIGLTSFGVGLDFGHELVYAISQVRGGNYFFLENAGKLRTVFDRDFDYLVTPLAYDLRITLTPMEGLRITEVYGTSAWSAENDRVTIEVPTVFLSRRRGAIVARLAGLPQGSEAPSIPLAMLSMSYLPTNLSSLVSTQVRASYDGRGSLSDEAVYFSGPGIRKAVALINMILAMKEACDLYGAGQKQQAIALLVELANHLRLEARALQDSSLDPEIALVEKLADNMK